MLINGNINLECEKAHNAFVKLFASVSPTVFRPVDPLLKVLFAIPNDLEESMHKLKRWLGELWNNFKDRSIHYHLTLRNDQRSAVVFDILCERRNNACAIIRY